MAPLPSHQQRIDPKDIPLPPSSSPSPSAPVSNASGKDKTSQREVNIFASRINPVSIPLQRPQQAAPKRDHSELYQLKEEIVTDFSEPQNPPRWASREAKDVTPNTSAPAPVAGKTTPAYVTTPSKGLDARQYHDGSQNTARID
ncbi:MAG: hypothetical protein L6R39_002320 [Caloplaca ligustica]|nr:MAG: hypothetical protein L6R39_002320 [Caloplaca ligustica]